MKNITFGADERLIEAARERARARKTTLNDEFRRWLNDYTHPDRDLQIEDAKALLEQIRSYAGTGGRRFTRDDMNER
jgi:hypothetical protein